MEFAQKPAPPSPTTKPKIRQKVSVKDATVRQLFPDSPTQETRQKVTSCDGEQPVSPCSKEEPVRRSEKKGRKRMQNLTESLVEGFNQLVRRASWSSFPTTGSSKASDNRNRRGTSATKADKNPLTTSLLDRDPSKSLGFPMSQILSSNGSKENPRGLGFMKTSKSKTRLDMSHRTQDEIKTRKVSPPQERADTHMNKLSDAFSKATFEIKGMVKKNMITRNLSLQKLGQQLSPAAEETVAPQFRKVKSINFGLGKKNPSPVVPPKDHVSEKSRRKFDIAAVMSGQECLPSVFQARYRVGDLLGDGAFGFVTTAIRIADGTEVAVKFISRSKIPDSAWVILNRETMERVPLEIKLLIDCAHFNVITHLDHFINEKYVILVTELHGTEWTGSNPLLNHLNNPGLKFRKPALTKDDSAATLQPCSISDKNIPRRTSCDLFECIDTRISDSIARRIFAQIALAVEHLQRKNIVHRDLKDENIVIDAKYWIKIIDFGSASPIPQKRSEYFTKFNGTAHFASPEVAGGQSFRGPEAEIWQVPLNVRKSHNIRALGVLLYTIIFGENPFHDKKDILVGRYAFPYPIDPALKDLIESMLKFEENERFTIEQVLSHEWLVPGVKEIKHEYVYRAAMEDMAKA